MTQPSEGNGKEATKQANAKLIDLQRLLESKLTDAVAESFIHRGMLTFVIDRGMLLDFCHRLKDDPDLAFDYLVCITSIDRGDCFEVAYNLRSLQLKHELCLRVKLARENPRIASVAHIWNGANWHEREAYDLMGIVFDGHPCLRRILLPEDWEGFPLRKDYEFDGEVIPDHQRRLCEIAAKMRGDA